MKAPHKLIFCLKNTYEHIPYLTKNTAFQLRHQHSKENKCPFMAIRPKRKIHALEKFRSLKFTQLVVVHWISTRFITFTPKKAVIFSSETSVVVSTLTLFDAKKILCIAPLTILCHTFKVFTIALNLMTSRTTLEDTFQQQKTCLTASCKLCVPSDKQSSLPLG